MFLAASFLIDTEVPKSFKLEAVVGFHVSQHVPDARVWVINQRGLVEVVQPVLALLLGRGHDVFDGKQLGILINDAFYAAVGRDPVNHTLHLLVVIFNDFDINFNNFAGCIFFDRVQNDERSVAEADDLLWHDSEEALLRCLAEILMLNKDLLRDCVRAAAFCRVAREERCLNSLVFNLVEVDNIEEKRFEHCKDSWRVCIQFLSREEFKLLVGRVVFVTFARDTDVLTEVINHAGSVPAALETLDCVETRVVPSGDEAVCNQLLDLALA